ncbi:MAG: hypothetical protein QGG40_22135, partial [Myxococcota bacterium]|nr:hypothetical protein [Myxococcota bacterium]
VGSVIVITLLQPKIYQSTVTLQIDARTNTYVPFAKSEMSQFGSGHYLSDIEYYLTQHNLLRSRSQARAVMDDLSLWEHEEFVDAKDAVGKLLGMVTIEPKEKTRLVKVYVEGSDTDLVLSVARSWGDVFVARNQDMILSSVRTGLEWMEAQLDEAKVHVESAERKLIEYKQANEILALSLDDRQNLLARELGELTGAKAQGEAERAIRYAEYQNLANLEANETDTMKLSLVVNTSLMRDLREQLAQLQTNRKGLLQTYGEKHPKVVEVNAKLANIEREIREEIRAEVSRRRTYYDLAKAKESELSSALQGRTGDVITMSEKEAEYGLLQREAESKVAMYEVLLTRLQELDISSSLQTNNIMVVDPAELKK